MQSMCIEQSFGLLLSHLSNWLQNYKKNSSFPIQMLDILFKKI